MITFCQLLIEVTDATRIACDRRPDVDTEQQLVSARREWTPDDHFWSAGLGQLGDPVLEHLLHQDHVEPAVELASDLDFDPNLTEPAGGMQGSAGLT